MLTLPASRTDSIVRTVSSIGANRLMVSAEEAHPYTRARSQGHPVPAVVFVRDDGWTLGASTELSGAAFATWPDKWVGFVMTPGFTYHPIAEYTGPRSHEKTAS